MSWPFSSPWRVYLPEVIVAGMIMEQDWKNVPPNAVNDGCIEHFCIHNFVYEHYIGQLYYCVFHSSPVVMWSAMSAVT
jgi:hypothetical protein